MTSFEAMMKRLLRHFEIVKVDEMKALVDDYRDHLAGYPDGALQRAADHFIAERRYTSFPKIAEIREFLESIHTGETIDLQAVQAAELTHGLVFCAKISKNWERMASYHRSKGGNPRIEGSPARGVKGWWFPNEYLLELDLEPEGCRYDSSLLPPPISAERRKEIVENVMKEMKRVEDPEKREPTPEEREDELDVLKKRIHDHYADGHTDDHPIHHGIPKP